MCPQSKHDGSVTITTQHALLITQKEGKKRKKIDLVKVKKFVHFIPKLKHNKRAKKTNVCDHQSKMASQFLTLHN